MVSSLKHPPQYLPKFSWMIFIGILVPLSGAIIADIFFSEMIWIHPPFHSVIESLGSIVALLLAILLLLLRTNESQRHYLENFWIICGLICMGILDAFHAASTPGNSFIWLHSLASFFGGTLFAMSWFRWNGPGFSRLKTLLWLLAIIITFIGLLSLVFHQYIPMMTDHNGFTLEARILNVGGGFFFYIAAIYFLTRYLDTQHFDSVLFATLALLFGNAGILFELSQLWNMVWWWWHIVKLLAYTIAFVFVIDYYIRLNRVNTNLIHDLSASNETLAEQSSLLELNEQRFELAVEATGDGIWDWDLELNKMYFSPRWKTMLGFEPEQLRSSFSEWQNLLHPEDLGPLLEAWGNSLDGTTKGYTLEYRMRTRSGHYIWVCSRAVVVRNASNKVIRMAGSHTDINDRKTAEKVLLDYQRDLEDIIEKRTRELQEANNQLEKLASIDSLTGICNRRLFDNGIVREWKRCSRENQPFSLMMLDIDFFKDFNDTFGHQQGDDVLRRVAEVLDNTVKRSTDIVARYGGEEFAIILPDTEFSQAMELANQIHNNIAALQIPAANPETFPYVTLSIGVGTHVPGKSDSWERHLASVDQALYQAKKYGRNQTAVAAKNK